MPTPFAVHGVVVLGAGSKAKQHHGVAAHGPLAVPVVVVDVVLVDAATTVEEPLAWTGLVGVVLECLEHVLG